MSPRGHRTQVAEDRPVSSINWHSTVKDHLAQDKRCLTSAVRTFFTAIEGLRARSRIAVDRFDRAQPH
jgi:hypothetical protein